MSFRRAAGDVADFQDRRDQHLVGRLASGDEQALAELLGRYGPAAFGAALRVLGDRAHAEDVLQEVFVSVWRNAASYDGTRGSVRTWLLTQIHHRSVDVVRREEAERRRTTTNYPGSGDEPTVEDVLEEHWLTERRKEVRESLLLLPEEQRRVLELAYFDGLTQSQVASRMNVPLGTVKSRTLAAMRVLRGALRPGGES